MVSRLTCIMGSPGNSICNRAEICAWQERRLRGRHLGRARHPLRDAAAPAAGREAHPLEAAHTAEDLARIADRLNDRPRKTLGFMKPSQDRGDLNRSETTRPTSGD